MFCFFSNFNIKVLVILKYSGFNHRFLHEGDEVNLTSSENLTRQKSLTGVSLCLRKKGSAARSSNETFLKLKGFEKNC